MLLAALDARRATRDADMLARGIDNDMENLRDVVSEIAAIELTDGIVFDVKRISLVTIREGSSGQPDASQALMAAPATQPPQQGLVRCRGP